MSVLRERVSQGALERVVQDVVAACEASSSLEPDTGIAVSVVARGEVAYQGVLGLRDRAAGLPVTTRTAFEVGSLTKSMIAAALVKLAARGRIDLDAPVGSGVLALPGGTRVTLADILSHRTGLPGHDLLWYLGGYSTRELAARVAHLDPIRHDRRGAFAYNNALYGCTALACEEILATPWERLVTDELLAPLGMRRTELDPAAVVDDEAQPRLGQAPTRRTPAASIAPAGAARSSVEDMTTWALAQLGRRPDVLSGDALRAMHEARVDASSLNPLLLSGLEWLGAPSYGVGWFVGEAAGEKAAFHMGLCDGFSTAVVLFPALGHAFVAMANANLSRVPGVLAEQLFAHLGGRERPRAQQPPPAPPPAPAPAPVVVAAPAGIEGTYDHPAYGTIEVARVHDAVRLSWRGNDWPLCFVGPREATLTVAAFGLAIPLPVAFSDDRVEIAMALDPGVAPQAFRRSR